MNLEAVLAADRPTIKHIPAKCKALWCAVLTRALSSAVFATSSNSGTGQEEQAWVELLCLPKAVLSQAPRAGRRHPKCQENLTMCMLQSWLDGDKERLIAAASRPADRRGRTSTGRSGRAKRCIELVEDGKDSQACRTLTSSGLAEDSQATFAALCSKHPQGFPVEPEWHSPKRTKLATRCCLSCSPKSPSKNSIDPAGRMFPWHTSVKHTMSAGSPAHHAQQLLHPLRMLFSGLVR